jgi:hypothetical protein
MTATSARLPLIAITRHYDRTYSKQARHAQDLTDDLATGVEESMLGIPVRSMEPRRRLGLGSIATLTVAGGAPRDALA